MTKSSQSFFSAVRVTEAFSKLSDDQRTEAQKLMAAFNRMLNSSQEVRQILGFWSKSEPLAPSLCKLVEITTAIAEYDFNAQFTNPECFDHTIDSLELTSRAKNCLKAERILLVGDLVQQSDDNLVIIPNLGRRSLNEIKEILATRGLCLGMDVGEWKSKAKG